VSVEFEPVRLGARRKRLDPVVFGAVLVAIALAVSVVKPWGDVSTEGTTVTESAAAVPSEAKPRATASASHLVADVGRNRARGPAT